MRRFLFVACISLICIQIAEQNQVRDIQKEFEKYKEDRWERLVNAICQVESSCDDRATNPRSSAAGSFQMLCGYVTEVNRILGEKRYHYENRFDPVKAREMFEIYQAHHNPNKDIDRAIIIHRGKKVESYIKAVKEAMK